MTWDEYKTAFNVHKAALDYSLGEVLVEAKSVGDTTFYKALLAKHQLTDSSASTLISCYKVHQQARGLLSAEDLNTFNAIGSSTKALVHRLPAARQSQAIIDLVSGELTCSSLKSLVRSDEVALEKANEGLSKAKIALDKVAAEFDSVTSDAAVTTDSHAYVSAREAVRFAEMSVIFYCEKVDKLLSTSNNNK